MTADQREIIGFLRDPASYGAGVERVEVIETHVSLVFLAGERAYKLKRAVKYPYLDFSTAEQRHRACMAELRLNRRTAPALYLELRAVARRPDGSIGFSSVGPALDWVVVMRRFDRSLLFDALATAGRLTPDLMRALADGIAGFHAAAEPRFEYGGAAALAETIEENRRCLAAASGARFEATRLAELDAASRHRLTALAPLLDGRRAAGKVRHGHGDLHLRNICLWNGAPTLFDCLEFSEALASTDVLYDLAFLLMDLEHRDLGDLGNRVLNRYLDRNGEEDGLAALPLFLSLRAAIRAHVTAGAAAPQATEARQYLDLAISLLRPRPPRLVAIGGPSGSGKSTLAAALAPTLGARPGARILRSDVIRKRLAGVPPETRLPPEAYTPESSRRVYEELGGRAGVVLAAGYSAVIDAVALRPEERRDFAAVAARAGVPFAGLWLAASPMAMTERLAARHNDASDATPEVLAQQLRHDPGPVEWTRIDADAGPQACVAAARRALALA